METLLDISSSDERILDEEAMLDISTSQTRKRKLLVEMAESEESEPEEKLQRVDENNNEVDPYEETRENCLSFLFKYNEMMNRSPENRLSVLNDWVDYFENQIEIRIESLKIEVEKRETNLIRRVNRIENRTKNADFKEKSKSLPLERLQKYEELIKFMHMDTKPQLYNQSLAYIETAKHVGCMYKYKPKYQLIDAAIKWGHLEDVEHYFEDPTKLVDINNSLVKASHYGHKKLVKCLLEKISTKGEVDEDDELNMDAAFRTACSYGHLEIVKILFKHNGRIKINKCGKTQGNPLMAASRNGHKNVVEFLIENKANVNVKDKYRQGCTALMEATKRDHFEVVKILVENKANVNELDCDRNSVLKLGINFRASRELIEFLIKNKANVNVNGQKGTTPLMQAAKSGLPEIVALLLQNKADVNAVDDSRETALIKAMDLYYPTSTTFQVASLLIDHKADVNAKNKKEERVLIMALRIGAKDVAQKLIESKAKVNVHSKQNKDTPLIMATKSDNSTLVELLLKNGADVNAKNKIGQTALLAGCGRHSSVKCVKLLLEYNADMSIKDNKGESVMDKCQNGTNRHNPTIEMLLEKGMDINAKNSNGETWLLWSCKNGSGTLIHSILKKNPDIHARNPAGETALIKASSNGCKGIVEALLRKGARINERDNEGYTSLLRAIQGGHTAVVSYLLDKRADINISSNGRETALTLASKLSYKSEEITQLIRDASSPQR